MNWLRAAGFNTEGHRVTSWGNYDRRFGAVMTVLKPSRVTMVYIIGPDGLHFSGEPRPGGIDVRAGDSLRIHGVEVAPA